VTDLRTKVATALWREEAERSQMFTVANRRTVAAFAKESHYTKDKWLRTADVAIAEINTHN